MARKQRVPMFDLWRVIGVALVIGVHLLQRLGSRLGGAYGFPGVYYVTLGGLGVTVLIVLSGIVLEYNYGDSTVAYGRFLYRRLVRLYPVYWLAMLATPLIMGFGAVDGHGADVLGWILDALGLLAFTGRPWGDMILPTGWFIGVIVSLYLLYRPMSRALRRWPIATIAVLLAVSVATRQAVFHYWPHSRAEDWFTLSRVFEFGLGIWIAQRASAVAWMQRRLSRWPEGALRLLAHLSALSFPAYLIHFAVQRMPPLDGMRLRYWLPAYLLSVLIASELLDLADSRIQRVLRRRAA